MNKKTCPDCKGPKDYRSKRCSVCAGAARKGQKRTEETKVRMSKAAKARGANRPKGFVQTDEHIKNRMISRYGHDTRQVPGVCKGRLQMWSVRIRERDGCCQKCGTTDDLHAHHIIPKKLMPNLALVDANGVALCHTCHWELHRILMDKGDTHADLSL